MKIWEKWEKWKHAEVCVTHTEVFTSTKLKWCVCVCVWYFCGFSLDLEMWGVLVWSWSATRGESSAAYRPFAFRYCTNRRRVSMYEDAHRQNLGWTDIWSRRKWSLDCRTDSLQPVPESPPPLYRRSLDRPPQQTALWSPSHSVVTDRFFYSTPLTQ